MRTCLPAFALLAATALAADDGAYVRLAGEDLARGRSTWLENCEGCHGYGIAGAPVPMKPAQWIPRLEKGKAVLYEHALKGFYGPDDTIMPARGGNPTLSDAQVKAAVDYMTALANHYIQHERN